MKSHSTINMVRWVLTGFILMALLFSGVGSVSLVKAKAALPAAVLVGMHDDTNGNWVYNGSWSTYSGSGPYNYTLHYSVSPGNSAQIQFTGGRFILYYTEYSNRGVVDIYVDGKKEHSLNQYGTSLAWQSSWTSDTYESGTHTVQIVHVSGSLVDIDAIQIVDPDSIAPAAVMDLAAAMGTSTGTVELSWTAPGDDGSDGTSTSYHVRYGAAEITDQTGWENATEFVNTLEPSAAGSAESLTVTGLVPGQTYYFSVRAQDEEPNLGDYSNSPSAAAASPTPVGTGTYDDRDNDWQFTGTWSTYNSDGPYSRTLKLSEKVGNSTQITFSGRMFILTYTKYVNRGTVDVYVDGDKVDTINQYGSSLAWQSKWSSSTYPTGMHTVQFVHAGGSVVDIDAIQIVDPDSTAPAAIDNLVAAMGTSTGTVELSWTAPGDDGSDGTSTSYHVRYAAAEITDQTGWENATEFVNTLEPSAAGSAENLTVTGLVPGQIYYFAVRAEDEQTNLGELSNSPSADAKSPSPVSSGTYDDRNENWTYTGTWGTYDGAGPYSSTLTYSETPGGSAQLTFSGVSFTLTFTEYKNRGVVDIYVDGARVYTLNQYSSTLAWQSTWTSDTYLDGVHTIDFVHVSGSVVDIDAIEIVDPDSTAPTAITTLAAVTGTSSGTVDLSWTAPGDDGTVGTASSYQVRYAIGSAINSYLDWNNAAVYNNNLAPKAAGSPENLEVTGLVAGTTYYFSVRAVDDIGNMGGLSNSPSASAQVLLNDDFATPTVISSIPYQVILDVGLATSEATDPAITACNSDEGLKTVWFSYTPTASGMLDLDTFGSGYDTIMAVWTGTAGNLTHIACNDNTDGTINSHVMVYVQTGTTYYIEVALWVRAPAPSFENTLIFNADFTQMSLLPVGVHDDGDPNITYTGTWGTYAGSGPFNNTLHLSEVMGRELQFSFIGRLFTLTYTGYANRGVVDIYVDGNKVYTLNQYNKALVWQKTWTSDVYDYGGHIVKIVHVSGAVADVDAISIVEPDVTAPHGITNLSATTGTSNGAVNLSWTASGDDGSTGTASAYQVRFALTEITTESDWNNADEFVNTLVPKIVGSAETLTVTGLVPGQTYYFAVRAEDEQTNLGSISNSPSAASKSPAPILPGLYDDTVDDWDYTGSWSTYNASGPYKSTLHISEVAGNSAQITFDGQMFILTYTKYANRGMLDVYVDGTKVDTINQYGSSLAWQSTWTSAAYPAGVHTVNFVHLSGSVVDIDAIQIVDPDSTAPAAITNLAAVTGTTVGSVDLSWTAPGDDGTDGTASSYQVRFAVAVITNQTDWDNATAVTSGVPTPLVAGSSQSMTVSGLEFGETYYFAVRARDEMNNQADLSNSPSADAKCPTPVGAGTYDDADANWIYDGTWGTYSGSGPADNSLHYSELVGGSAMLAFHGTQFILTYTGYINRGVVEIYVDGDWVYTLDQYSTALNWQSTWASDTFDLGDHTVEIVHVNGALVDVDAIQIIE
ncbi:MAG: fibronectin type III domain-containing protein [Anaerolineales bacterium]|nr:fibronectin type III domain-containing protein [Anaerolineales bacterium]